MPAAADRVTPNTALYCSFPPGYHACISKYMCSQCHPLLKLVEISANATRKTVILKCETNNFAEPYRPIITLLYKA